MQLDQKEPQAEKKKGSWKIANVSSQRGYLFFCFWIDYLDLNTEIIICAATRIVRLNTTRTKYFDNLPVLVGAQLGLSGARRPKRGGARQGGADARLRRDGSRDRRLRGVLQVVRELSERLVDLPLVDRRRVGLLAHRLEPRFEVREEHVARHPYLRFRKQV